VTITDWTFHRACSALATLITDAVNDPEVRIVDGFPGEGDTGYQHVYVAGVSRGNRTPRTTHGASQENYEILIAIRVINFEAATDARARAVDLLNTITQAVADNERLNRTVSRAILENVDSIATKPRQDGWFTDIVARVTVEALRG
jgi:hypothetical protein